jgi:SAM-dependent methyltransferase
MLYNDDKELEQSPVVANCCMNRERDLCGTNGYDVEVGLHPLNFLGDKVANNGKARWLDLCCGTGKALVQAATIVERDGLPIEIVGVDLVGMFMPHSSRHLALIEASLSIWKPAGAYDLITCIHGLHYIGDKLGLIARACSWLNHDGLFVANLDIGNLRLNPSGSPSRVFAKELRQAGVEYLPSKRLLRCKGHRTLSLPFAYVEADDEAGPNYTKQPVVNSHYERQ